jgi:peptidyl-prolyl cis-trans isomerase A (cyclophilin A)
MVEALEERYLLTVSINAISNQTGLPAGKTLIVPVSGTDSAGNPITYSVSSSNNSAVSAQVLTGNTFMEIEVSIGGVDKGAMIFELFNDMTPNTVSEITKLVDEGFYDNLTFHRVIPNFVIQGGDPNGDGTGGPGFTFPDEYNADLIYSGNGQLAMANSGPDTNGSQFFITIGAQRGLDFNNPIFGQIVEGQSVRDEIAQVQTDSNDKPIAADTVVMTSVKIIQDTTDCVLLLTSPSATDTDAANITVTAKAADGNDSVSFTTTPFTDTTDDPPFLNAVANQTTTVNVPVTFNLSATNISNDQLTYEAIPQGSPANATATVNGSSVTVTPTAGFSGTISLLVGVEETGATARGNDSNTFDTHLISINVLNQDAPITASGTTLAANPGVAFSGDVANFSDADTTLSAGSFGATISWGDGTSSTGAVSAANSTEYQVNGGHTYATAGNYNVTVTITHLNPASGLTASRATVASMVDVTTAALTGNIQYVQQLYIDILNRAADLSGLNYWVGALTNGQATRAQVAYLIETSPEAYTIDVELAYQKILGRAADTSGLNAYVSYLEKGGTIENVDADLAGSQELWAKSGSEINPYMNALYQAALGRNCDSAGLNDAIFLITKHYSLSQIAYIVFTSAEAHQDLISTYYTVYMGRAVDSTGLQGWLAAFNKGADELVVEAQILGSDELFSHFKG